MQIRHWCLCECYRRAFIQDSFEWCYPQSNTSIHECTGCCDSQASAARNSQEAELLLKVVGDTNGKFPALSGVPSFKQIRLNWERLFPTRNVNKEPNTQAKISKSV